MAASRIRGGHGLGSQCALGAVGDAGTAGGTFAYHECNLLSKHDVVFGVAREYLLQVSDKDLSTRTNKWSSAGVDDKESFFGLLAGCLSTPVALLPRFAVGASQGEHDTSCNMISG